MIEVFGPKSKVDEHNRIIDCELALELGFQLLAEAGEKARWTKEEVAIALFSLSASHIRAIHANAEIERPIDLAQLAKTTRVRNMFS